MVGRRKDREGGGRECEGPSRKELVLGVGVMGSDFNCGDLVSYRCLLRVTAHEERGEKRKRRERRMEGTEVTLTSQIPPNHGAQSGQLLRYTLDIFIAPPGQTHHDILILLHRLC